MDNSNKGAGTGIGFCDVLAIIFIVLKLVGVINWSWWIVLLPILIPVGILVLFIILMILLGGRN
jgi:hypothetical protein